MLFVTDKDTEPPLDGIGRFLNLAPIPTLTPPYLPVNVALLKLKFCASVELSKLLRRCWSPDQQL